MKSKTKPIQGLASDVKAGLIAQVDATKKHLTNVNRLIRQADFLAGEDLAYLADQFRETAETLDAAAANVFRELPNPDRSAPSSTGKKKAAKKKTSRKKVSKKKAVIKRR